MGKELEFARRFDASGGEARLRAAEVFTVGMKQAIADFSANAQKDIQAAYARDAAAKQQAQQTFSDIVKSVANIALNMHFNVSANNAGGHAALACRIASHISLCSVELTSRYLASCALSTATVSALKDRCLASASIPFTLKPRSTFGQFAPEYTRKCCLCNWLIGMGIAHNLAHFIPAHPQAS